MPSDLQVSNIKDLTGSNTGLSIASDGQVTISQNNPTITLGSNATFPNQTIVGWQKTLYTGAQQNMSGAAEPSLMTVFGSHSHVFKTATDGALLVVQCYANVNIYDSNAIEEQAVSFAIRSDADSYGSNLDGSGQKLQLERASASVTNNNQHFGTQCTFTTIINPTRSVGDTDVFKIYMINIGNSQYIRTAQGSNTKVIWTSYEVIQ